MSQAANLTGGVRHVGALSIEGRLLEGHTAAANVASVGAEGLTLTLASAKYQKITATAAFDLVLPPEESSAGLSFHFASTAASGVNTFAIKNDAGSTIVSLDASEQVIVACDGTSWISMGISPAAGI